MQLFWVCVYVWCLHIYLTYFSCFKNGSPACRGRPSLRNSFLGPMFVMLLCHSRRRTREVLKRSMADLEWYSAHDRWCVWLGQGNNALGGADGVQWCLAGREVESSAGLGVTGSLSNGGSGGSTGSSVGMMSIPWCSGAERNLGHCFGNQGGGRCADR